MNNKISLYPYDTIIANSVSSINNCNPKDCIDFVCNPDFRKEADYGNGITIAVIDTGIDKTHNNLKERIIGVKNFTDEGSVDDATDNVGHGTLVSGIIAGYNCGNSFYGMAPKANILALKALTNNGGAYSWIVNAINYAVDQNVDIINMSLGGKVNEPSLEAAVKRAVEKGILVICAAGNDGDNRFDTDELNYPAMYHDAISVGSISYLKKSSSFSASNNEIDLLAPGENVLSTYPGNRFSIVNGTSFSAPYVSGALALLKNYYNKKFGRSLTEPELYSQLIKNTITLGYDKKVEGNGRLYLGTELLINGIIQLTKNL